MSIRTWLSIHWPFSPKTRLIDLDGATLVKLIRIANNKERFRNVQTR